MEEEKLDIDKLGKGARPDPPDNRDFEAPMGAVTVNWTHEFRLPEPPSFDQRSSDCCVACAWSYYHWQLKGKIFSKRDLFCRIFQDYGAYIRDGGLALVKDGQADNKEVKDPSSPTASNMRSAAGTKPEFRIDDQEFSSFTLPQQDIDGIAWGISQYKGVVFGVNGTNEGWRNPKYPEPPSMGVDSWGHALYAFGYHICSNGEKCIIAKSSWSSTNEHHIRRTYFVTGNTFSAWTLIPKKQLTNKPMYKKAVHLDGKTFAALILTPNGSQTIDATSEEVWRSFSKEDSYQLNTVNADGTTNFDKSDCVQLPW